MSLQKTAPTRKREHPFLVYLNEQEFETLAKEAEEHGRISCSDMIRILIIDRKDLRDAEVPLLQFLLRERSQYYSSIKNGQVVESGFRGAKK